MDDIELALKREELDRERSKAKWTAFSVVVPLLAAVLTVVYGIWSANEQARRSFQLEAAKSAFAQGKDPFDAFGRVRFYAALFPSAFPKDFIGQIDPKNYGHENVEPQLEFVKLVSGRGLNAAQTAELYRTVFSEDAWAHDDKLLRALNSFTPEGTPASK